jgi:molybdenum cofactor cytidylyltransferase
MVSIAGLLLAAGKSERMGRPKLMLDFRGKTFLEHIFEQASQSALTEVKVVIGHHAEWVQSRFPHLEGKWIVNPDYQRGQLSSLQCGLSSLNRNSIDGIMLFLIDHPFVNRMLINQLIESFEERRSLIIVPSYNRRRGHPVIFSRLLFDELSNASLDYRASDVIRSHENEIFYVEVGNPGVLVDIDTPEDYSRYVFPAGARKKQGEIS